MHACMDSNLCIYIYIYIYIHIYIYVYSKYHTITDVCTIALLLTKPSSHDGSWFRHGFGAETSLPLAQSTPAVSHDTTRLFLIVVTLWDCHIHADAVRALSWIFSMYFLLSDGGIPLYKIAISTLMQLQLYLGFFPCISSCLMEEFQD